MGTTRRNRKPPDNEVDDEIDAKSGMSMNDESDKQGKRSRKRGASSKGGELKWRNVTAAADSLLVGSSEGGFLSLEEIDGDSWLEISGAEELPTTAAASKSSSERKKRKKRHAAEGAENSTGVANPSETASLLTLKRKKQKRDAAPATHLEADKILPSIDSEENVERKTLPSIPGEENIKRKKKKTKKKKKPKPALSATELNLSNSVDVLTALADVGEKAVEQQEGFRKGKRNAKEKKPKLGSRARRLLRGKISTESTELKAVQGAEPVEVPADVVDEEPIDMSAWAEMRLHTLLEKSLCELKFREPTPIQRQCIPAAAHKGKDVIGAAETGSGKTLAFGLPILQRLLEEQEKESSKHMISEAVEENVEETSTTGRSQGPLRALIITPTRELALQVCEHLKVAAKWTGIRVVPIVGGMATQKQQRLLKQKPEIVVGTPGRLWELMSGGDNHLLELHWLSFFVLDEADRMVEKGHFKELQSIIDMLPGKNVEKESGNVELSGEGIAGSEVGSPSMPQKRRQTLVFSATLALPAEFKSKLKRGQMLSKAALKSIDSVAVLSARAGVSHEAAIVDLTSSTVVAEKLTESILECRDEEKDDYLYYILKVHAGGLAIVFCTSIAALRRVSAILKLLQIPVIPLHAQMQQKARLKAMDRFRKDKNCVLVATDVAARGLDVPGIRTVVHYQLPHSAEIYVHRSGRTARGASGGISIALVSPSDRSKYLTLCRALSKPDGLQTFPVNMTYLPAIQKRVSLAGKVDKHMRKHSASKATEAWLARNAEAMDIDMEVSEDEDNGTNNRKSSKDKGSPQLRGLQKELQLMLSQPLKPKAFSNRYVTGGGMTSLVTRQLQDYMMAKTGLGGLAGSGKQLVIGQERIDPLEALQLAATIPDVKRKRY